MSRLILSVVVGCLFFLFSCKEIDRTIHACTPQELETLSDFQRFQIPRYGILPLDNEPGQKVFICVSLMDADTEKALGFRRILMWHADSSGTYHPESEGDLSTTKIIGNVVTNVFGHAMIQTILPGESELNDGNRVIHINVNGAKSPRLELYFSQYTSSKWHKKVAKDPTKVMCTLKKDNQGNLVAFATIPSHWE